MKLTPRSEYALLALVYLARSQADGFVPAAQIARAQEIPAGLLEQILLVLESTHYLRRTKGRPDGYRLARAEDKISLAEIIRLFDGVLAPGEVFGYELNPIEKEAGLVQVFGEIQACVSRKLEATTLADVLQSS